MASGIPIRSSLHSVALCAFAYLYVFPYFPAINNPNENVRLYMTAALAEEGRYEIDTLRKRWGWVNDAARFKGHVYSVKAPGTSYLAVPAYAAYHALATPFDRTVALWLCRLTASILPTLAFLVLFHRFLCRTAQHTGASPAVREAVFFSIALGSLLYGYAILLVSHTTCAAAAFAGLALLWPAPGAAPPGAKRAGTAGLLIATVTLLEYPGFVVSVALACFGLARTWRRRAATLAFILGGLVPTLAMMHFQWSAFDSPFTPGHLFVESQRFRARHHEGFYGAVGVSWEAVYGLFLAPGRGLFPLTPVTLFAVPGFYILARARATRAPAITAIASCAATALAITSMNNWSGGWTIGPRYLAVTMPFLGWAALVGLGACERIAPAWTATIAIACTVVGLVLSGLPSAYYPHLPPEVERPVGDVIVPLWSADLAPYNAGQLLGLDGNVSMLPLLLCALLAVYRCAERSQSKSGLLRAGCRLAAGLAAGLLVASLLAAPQDMGPHRTKQTQGALRFIKRTWVD
ncbi:MAG: hypothetical protein OXR73_10560 [Myxococcales bacterium]|nr:hypothetical protein [Myxococcales bacterium]